MEAPPGKTDALPRWARYAGIPLAGILLTLLFIHLGFPYEPFVADAFRKLESERGLAIRYEQVSSHLGFLGPGVEARTVVVSRSGDEVAMDRLILRPAWSTSWLRGQPSVHFDARMPIGRAKGAIALGGPGSIDASFDDLDLATLPIAAYVGGAKLRGSLDGEVDILFGEEGEPTGSANLAASDGSIAVPGQSVAIPFVSLLADLAVGSVEQDFLTIESADLTGPMVSISASGRVTKSRRGPGRLDVELQFAVVDEGLTPVLRGMGVQLGRDGKATAKLAGTLARPLLR